MHHLPTRATPIGYHWTLRLFPPRPFDFPLCSVIRVSRLLQGPQALHSHQGKSYAHERPKLRSSGLLPSSALPSLLSRRPIRSRSPSAWPPRIESPVRVL